MKTYKEIVHKRQAIDTVICDLCGAKADENGSWSSENDENTNYVTIEHRHGDRWNDVDSTEVDSVDVCPSCFTTKVRPYIEKLGAKFVTRYHSE